MRVTIAAVIVARDAAADLPAALASIAAQDEPADEVIVVDDGSTDATAAIARAAGATVLACGCGEPAARNVGLRAASSEHVAFLDADDTWPVAYLRTVRGVIARTGAALVVAGTHERNAAGEFVRARPAMTARTADELFVHGGFKPSLATVQVAAALGVGGFDEQQVRSCDLEFALRLLASGVVPERVDLAIGYRVRDEVESRAKLLQIEAARERLLAHVRGTSVSETVADQVATSRRLMMARRWLKAGHPREARRLALQELPAAEAVQVAAASLVPRRTLMGGARVVRRLRGANQRTSTPR